MLGPLLIIGSVADAVSLSMTAYKLETEKPGQRPRSTSRGGAVYEEFAGSTNFVLWKWLTGQAVWVPVVQASPRVTDRTCGVPHLLFLPSSLLACLPERL